MNVYYNIIVNYERTHCTAIAGNLDTDCGDPGTPANGKRSIISTILDSVVNYTCNKGFTLVGSATRTCQPNEEWNGDLPVCDRKYI